LRLECRSRVIDEQYYVCTSPDCETVYYDEAGGSLFDKSDLTVRFGLKETDSPRPVCYCFDHTVEEIHDEIRRTERSTVMEDIKAKMKDPGCRCEYTNPLGGCCLKTVQAAVADGFRNVGGEEAAVAVGAVNHADCCAGDKPISKENAMSDCCSSHQKDMNKSTASAPGCCQTEVAVSQTSPGGDRAGALAAGGSVLAAILSSACCWLPLVLIAFGASAAGVAGFFAEYRPFFIAGAIGLLSLGFYMVYFRKEKCQPGSACATPHRKLRRVNQVMLWTSAVLVGGFVFFPNYVGAVFGAAPPANADVANAGLATAVYHIDGMTCQGCADILGGKLAKLPNVKGVKVDFDKKTALLRFDPAKPVTPKQVIASVKAAGYSAALSRRALGH